MSAAGDFIDYTLQRESSWEKEHEARERLGNLMDVYGASMGAVRGTVRDALKRHKDLDHDQVTALGSELWSVPVFERRLAAIVLLQSKAGLLLNTDLTRLEGFLRQSGTPELVDPLATDVIRPLLDRLDGQAKERAQRVVERWSQDSDPWLNRAAALAVGSPAP
ncbi:MULTISPECIES: DNA alkylation repair protein [unclassified Paenarthrobacter]|uniref:DNA alkylation repair protein n=1 Tax=unclassified Paenarthrobacter TaxID=2634190 RepID=UPI003CF10A16